MNYLVYSHLLLNTIYTDMYLKMFYLNSMNVFLMVIIVKKFTCNNVLWHLLTVNKHL